MNKQLKTRLEIGIGVVLVVIVTAGILFFIFRVTPANDNNVNPDGLSGLPVEPIKYLDVKGKTSFSLGTKTLNLPSGSLILSGYNNTSSSEFICIGDPGTECTIYDIDVSGITFYISQPLGIRLRSPIAPAKTNKNLTIAGETVSFTYSQRKFVNTVQNSEGQVISVTDAPEVLTIEEIFGCNLRNSVCFSSGRLSEDKATNDQQVAKFEAFVQAVIIN